MANLLTMSTAQLLTVLEETADLLQKTQVNLRKCPKARLTKGYIEARLQCVEQYWDTFKHFHQELIKCTPKKECLEIPYLTNEEYYTNEDLYLCICGDLKDMLSVFSSNQSSQSQPTQGPVTTEERVKLPRIQPPAFSGNYEDWPTFQDLFKSLIHDNPSLTNVMKLHFLKNSVTGEAQSLLKNVQVTDKNYEQAWKILKDRYGNKRIIVNAILKRLFSQRKITAQTASQIKTLLDTTNECLSSLLNLKVSTESWGPLIVHLVVMKLDTDTHKDWEEHSFKGSPNELPTWCELKEFLETKFRTLEFITSATTSAVKQTAQRSFYTTTTTPPVTRTCLKCNENHTLSHCKEFGNMPVSERIDYVKTNNLCFNCLLVGHSVFKCRLPTSCQICHKRHHSLLHQAKSENMKTHFGQVEDNCDIEEPEVEDEVEISTHFVTKRSTTLLATALVLIKDDTGRLTTLRALIDQGSQACFITERAVQSMKLKKTPTSGTVTGVGSTRTTINSVVHCEVLSRYDTNFNLNIKAYVLASRLTTELPTRTITTAHRTWSHLIGLDLADPTYNQSARVDMLLGVDVYAQILKDNIIKGPPGSPCAQNTSLGWILFGDVENNPTEDVIVMHHNLDIDLLVRNMWELESPKNPELTSDEKLCESIYTNTTTRAEDGRYIVKLPTKTDNLRATNGNTKDIALKRFRQLERKFERDITLKTQYTQVINDYITLKHIEEVPEEESNNASVYLPHHAVIRDDKETTKVRVVFDASSKGTNNTSLNDELLVGPQLQDDMRDIIMRWRMKRICFVADIQKMYRQIMVTREDKDLQRLVWRQNSADIIKEFRLLRVTFGTASAPYLAVKTLQKVAEDEGSHHHLAVKTIKEDFYMDDLMSGQDSVEESLDVAKAISNILKKGGFELQKWASNSPDFLKEFEISERSSKVNMAITLDGTIRALGLSWNMGEDNFQYELELPPPPDTITKRNILAEIQKLFDPLGWLAPSIIQAKMIIQKLWLHRSSWDEEVDPKIKEQWLHIRDNFKYLKNIKIPRWLHTTKPRLDKVTIHGFCDASVTAYAAVAYLRVETEEGDFKTNIIAAKARVAPVKPISLPRLELCGATLLAKLLKQIREAMKIPESQVFAWTDSTIVLSWLKGDPNRWQTFVRNRVVSILDDVGDKWYHVKSQCNPADVASRGTHLQELILHNLWWTGPKWLSSDTIPFDNPDLTTDLEKKQKIITNLKVQEEQSITSKFEDFDDLKQLITTICYCKRFFNQKRFLANTAFTTDELELALNICIKLVQEQTFYDEIDLLKRNKHVKHDSPLKSLNPYLDNENILRVGGRLRHSNLSEDNKHPIILNNKNRLVTLLVADAHIKTAHGGLQLTMCYLRNKFWILKCKGIIKSHLHRCLICARQRATVTRQLMGDLPKQRVTPARPFLNSGVDFAGPYQTLMSRGRGVKTTKSYIAIFVCMATRAIHLDLVGDLTSEAFVGAFRRFVSRRGRCAHLWSDQGRNFVGASKALADAFNEAKLDFDVEIANKLAQDGTQWHFIPAYSPNFGGLWEAGVKSVKYHLKRILNSHLTFEEMTTVLCQIEACLNSRPYSPIDDNDSTDPLTPGHFLIGEAPITIPSPTFNNFNDTMHGGSVLWFRHGLRLHDNPALNSALEDRSLPFFPLFIFDGETAGTKMVGYNRMRYLLEALDDLDSQFRKHGGRLIMIKGRPKDVIKSLWEEFGINKLCFEQDCEPVWRERDDTVKIACHDIGVTCYEHVSHTLWEPDTVIRANGGIPPLTYQMFLHTVATIGDPPRPVDDVDLTGVQFKTLPERFYKEFTVFDKTPKPEDFGVHQENQDIRMIRWTGGETSALRQMKQRLEVEYETFCRGSYLPTHGSPDLLGPPISLSPALRFGCLSVRCFYWSIHDLYNQVHQGRLPYTHSITGQLIWREYFYTMSVNNPYYGQMSGNPICLDIPWKEPKGEELKSWTEGRTGFPFIDAAMRQLRIEGWLHHAVRNTVASFLTRGTLWMSWEHGLNHFLKYLLDADWSVCAGNWMWVSSSAFEALLDSGDCACPVRLGQRLDPSGEYVRRYVPELTNMPDLYIYEPWKAPIDVQERAQCVIGQHYPEPIVNHLTAAECNRRAMKDLRQMLEKAPPHCCPSSEDEIRHFMWLYDDPQPVISV